LTWIRFAGDRRRMSRSCWFGVLAVLASCKDAPVATQPVSNTATRPTAASSPCGEMSCIDLGRAHELGTGRARDYHAAAAAYRRGCDAGDAVACRLLADAIMLFRSSEPMDASDVAYERACTLGDVAACWHVSEHTYLRDSVGSDAVKQAAKDAYDARTRSLLPRLIEACRRGDVAACEVEPCPECECYEKRCKAAKDARELALCLKGSSTSCVSVAVNVCGFDRACIAELPPSATADERAAFERMKQGCAAGDPDLCVALGRPIPYDELCAAHDDLACRAVEREREKIGN
jgi:hypothetical protein